MATAKTHEENVPEEQGGVVTTVRQNLPENDPELKQAMKDAGHEEPPEKEEKEKEVVKEPIKDDDKIFDRSKLTPEAQKFIDRQAKERRLEKRESTRRLEALQAQIDELKKASGKQEQRVAEPAELKKPVMPKWTEFSSGNADKDSADYDAAVEKYHEDMAEYKLTAKEREREMKTAAQKQAEADQAAVDKFHDEQAKFIEEHDDYEELMDQELNLSPVMFGAIIENGPWLGYHFAKNPDDAAAIRKLSEDKQIAKIERIIVRHEIEVEAADKTKKKEVVPPMKTPNKPPPIEPTSGRKAGERDRSQMTFKEREAEYARTHPGELNYQP